MIQMKILEQKIQGTKKQVGESKKKAESPATNPKLRELKKHLRRLQRKRRVLLAREKKLTKKEEPKKEEFKEQAAAEKPAEAKAAEAKPVEAKPAE